MADFTLKRGDTKPALAATLMDNAAPIDLTAATAVKLKMRQVGGTALLVDTACTFVGSRTTGQVAYQWGTADTATAGNYEIEFEITWNDSTVETVPNSGFNTVSVMPDMRAGQVSVGPPEAVEPLRAVGWQRLR